jgi:polar amino acid transport system ATP-binding protein
LARPDEGRVWLNGTEVTDPAIDIDKIRQKIGFVFQEFNLFNHLNALKNVSIGLEKVKRIKKDKARKIALEQLRRVGLQEHTQKYPAELSGGQKQRVAIARALAMNPIIMFYDEPTSALDPQLIGEVLEVMKELAKERMTSLVVTHEMGFAQSVGDEMLFMMDGRILERGPPQELMLRCQYDSTRKFFERIQELYGKERS